MDETFVLLLLADSNLPTGSFVASSGLESYATHGCLSIAAPDANAAKTRTDGTLAFVRDSLHSYAHSALPFVSDAHRVVFAVTDTVEQPLASLIALDALYEAMTLNHVARRASTAQGVALLTLYAKAFAPDSTSPSAAASLVDNLKLAIRRGETHGHLPVCFGVLTAALGLSLARTQHLALFLHARSLLSAAVRLNTIGPYLAQQLLLRHVSGMVDGLVLVCGPLRTGIKLDRRDEPNQDPPAVEDEVESADGPATTWPLGEIIAIRHDLQHSRIFNS
ncbi:UreF-domain-containing protein [Phlebopus sp. FC_14]|nr:UreF-domain-containing protein [Phlebopus sp. FC_14]